MSAMSRQWTTVSRVSVRYTAEPDTHSLQYLYVMFWHPSCREQKLCLNLFGRWHMTHILLVLIESKDDWGPNGKTSSLSSSSKVVYTKELSNSQHIQHQEFVFVGVIPVSQSWGGVDWHVSTQVQPREKIVGTVAVLATLEPTRIVRKTIWATFMVSGITMH
jgi:hypothetical protein